MDVSHQERSQRGQGREAVVSAPAWHWGIPALLIAVVIVGFYWPTYDNEFVMFDDRKYIYENPLIIGDGGLGAIWSNAWNKKIQLHYYPLTYTTFWLEHQLVGLAPPEARPRYVGGQPAHPLYHIDQMLLHALNATLVLLVLRMLGIGYWTAVLTAGFFAIHPINVASVAWVAERKNLVSALFFWLSLLVYMYHRRDAARRVTDASRPHGSRLRSHPLRSWRYLLSIVFFALSLLAKASTLMLAPLLIFTDRVLDQRWSRAAVWRSLPYFALAVLISLMTITQEALSAKSWAPIALPLRPFIACAAIIHYLQKMVLPFNQAIIYPRWAESLAEPRYWLSLMIFVIAAGLVWRFRRQLGIHWLWGIATFLLTISPILGLKYFIWMQFAYVSDHYMYLGSVGVILMLTMLVAKLITRLAAHGTAEAAIRHRKHSTISIALVGAMLILCGWRTAQQADTWQDNKTLWTHTVSVSPDAFVANLNLGNYYWRQGDYANALHYHQRCIEIDPTHIGPHYSTAQALRVLGRIEEALTSYRNAIAVAAHQHRPAYRIHYEYAQYLVERHRYREALAAYEAMSAMHPPKVERVRAVIQELKTRLNSASES